MPRIYYAGDEIKEHHEIEISLHGVFADFIEGSFICAYGPRVYYEKISVSLHFIYKKLCFTCRVQTERNSEKKIFLGSLIFNLVVNINYR
jgi:small basic protein